MGQISRGLNAQLWGNSGKNLQEIQKESGKKNDERQLSSIYGGYTTQSYGDYNGLISFVYTFFFQVIFYGFYHGNSPPLNHHLENIFSNHQISKSKKTILAKVYE